MPRKIESLMLAGPAGRLESLLEEPEHGDPIGAALVCHPHPQHGGTMHNKVVYRIARGLRSAGHVVLRFNYRGVNLSQGTYAQGEGELDDARAARDFLTTRYPHAPVTLAGFSFGSWIVLRLACEPPPPLRVIAVGFPLAYKDQARLSECNLPRTFIWSTQDEYAPIEDARELVSSLAEPKRFIAVEAKDHFFAGGLDELERRIAEIGSERV